MKPFAKAIHGGNPCLKCVLRNMIFLIMGLAGSPDLSPFPRPGTCHI